MTINVGHAKPRLRGKVASLHRRTRSQGFAGGTLGSGQLVHSVDSVVLGASSSMHTPLLVYFITTRRTLRYCLLLVRDG